MKYFRLLIPLILVSPLLGWTPIPDEMPLGSATVRLHLKEPWRAEQFVGGTPRIAFSLLNDRIRDGVAEFQIFRSRIPRLEDKSSIEAITDALVIGFKIDFSKAIFGRKIPFKRAPYFVTKLPQREVYWYVPMNRRLLRAEGETYVRVGVIITPELFSEGVVYIVTGYEVNDGRMAKARHFGMLDQLVKALHLQAAPARKPDGNTQGTR